MDTKLRGIGASFVLSVTKSPIILVITVAWLEVKKSFRRNSLGIFWQIPQHVVYILAIGLLSAAIFGTPMTQRLHSGALGYFGYLVLSVPFIGSANFQMRFPILDFVPNSPFLKVGAGLVIHLFNVGLAALVLIPIAIGLSLVGDPVRIALIGISLLLAFPFLFGLSLLISLLHLRFRDVEEIVNSIGRPWFLSLPVFWDESLISSRKVARSLLIDFNPFGAIVSSIRSAALGEPLRIDLLLQIFISGVFLCLITYFSCIRLDGKIKTLVVLR